MAPPRRTLTDQSADDPIAVLRNRIVKMRVAGGRVNETEALALSILVWNAYRAGVTRTKRRSNHMPEFKTFLTVMGAVTILVLAAAGGAAAGSLVTSMQIKNNTIRSVDVRDNDLKGVDITDGSLTGADIKAGSIPAGDLVGAPSFRTWTAHFVADGTTKFAQVNSVGALPVNVMLRPLKLTFTGDTSYCVAHGDAANPSTNTGVIRLTVSGPGGELARWHSATTLLEGTPWPASGSAANIDAFVAATGSHLQVTADCEDATAQTAVSIPMQAFTVTLTFRTTPVAPTNATAFH